MDAASCAGLRFGEPPTSGERIIEVKGRAVRGQVQLTENEWPTAANVRDKYWLYVVTDCATELRFLEARQTVARGINAALVVLYWNIGQRIRRDILKEKRAEYGEQIFHSLSGKLTAEFGRGFTKTNLFNMVRFAEAFPDSKIMHALSAQLSWLSCYCEL